jgi:branched-subunit amino acid aminotransferase/4-amino-4-deoxychorismate lyase
LKVPSRVWLNGKIVRARDARLSIFDRGFLYGDAVFETVRLYEGHPFLWQRHRKRLQHSLDRLGLPHPETKLEDAIEELSLACRLSDAAVRITVTRGVGEGLIPPEGLSPTILLTARTVPEDLATQRASGVAVIRLPFGNGGQSVVTGHKTTSYAAAIQGRLQAARTGAYEAIYVEADGRISEATTSNVFAVFGRTLHTPPLEAGCLPGITRQIILELAQRANLRVREAPIEAARLDRASEIFLTGSVIEVLPVSILDGTAVGKVVPGPITTQLSRAYNKRIQSHIRQSRRTSARS